MKLNKFIIQSANSQLITPQEYGAHAVKWSIDIAEGEIKGLIAPAYRRMLLTERIMLNAFPAIFSVAAFYVGAYWFYARGILGASEPDVVEAIENGTATGITESLVMLKHLTVKQQWDMAHDFLSLCRTFTAKHGSDYLDISMLDPNVFNNNCSSAAKECFEMICRIYLRDGERTTEVEQYTWTFNILDKAIQVFYTIQRDEVGIGYV